MHVSQNFFRFWLVKTGLTREILKVALFCRSDNTFALKEKAFFSINHFIYIELLSQLHLYRYETFRFPHNYVFTINFRSKFKNLTGVLSLSILGFAHFCIISLNKTHFHIKLFSNKVFRSFFQSEYKLFHPKIVNELARLFDMMITPSSLLTKGITSYKFKGATRVSTKHKRPILKCCTFLSCNICYCKDNPLDREKQIFLVILSVGQKSTDKSPQINGRLLVYVS